MSGVWKHLKALFFTQRASTWVLFIGILGAELGLLTGVPACGLSMWLGLPHSLVASGELDFLYGGSRL